MPSTARSAPLHRGLSFAVLSRLAAACLLSFLFTGCRIEPITPTAAASQTQTPTIPLPLDSLLPTLESTPTAEPPATPTPTPRNLLPPEAGGLLFRDALDSNRSGWPLADGPTGAISFADKFFSFTVRTPNTSLESILPRKLPADLYAEVTVTTTICGSDVDAFGIVFRAQSEQSYRYTITCSGKMRFEWFRGMAMEGAKVWQDVPAILPGAPAENRIGVLVQGGAFRFFVSGQEIYATTYTIIPSGGLGMFARTEKSDLLTVAFSDLAVYALIKP